MSILNNIKVAFFDIDGTIHLGDSLWEAIHKKNSTWETLGIEYLQQYLDKKITFEEFAILDVKAWAGAPAKIMEDAINEFSLHKEVEKIFEKMITKNTKIFLISSGISQLAEALVKKYYLTGYYANDVIIRNGFITGEILINVGYEDKGIIVKKILEQENIPRTSALAIGDSYNDLLMFKEVDYPILLNNKNKLADYDSFHALNWNEVLKYLF